MTLITILSCLHDESMQRKILYLESGRVCYSATPGPVAAGRRGGGRGSPAPGSTATTDRRELRAVHPTDRRALTAPPRPAVWSRPRPARSPPRSGWPAQGSPPGPGRSLLLSVIALCAALIALCAVLAAPAASPETVRGSFCRGPSVRRVRPGPRAR